jgi:hypothetical protein
MPSKFTVGVVLDNATIGIWESLPIGERSKRIREALTTASVVMDRDRMITKRDLEIKEMRELIADMKLFMTNFRMVEE